MLKTIEDVVKNRICTGCGTCTGNCRFHALAMKETGTGTIVPVIDKDKCTHCGICDRVCPQINISQAMADSLSLPDGEPVKDVFLAKASDSVLVTKGQTGGFVRALLAWALDTGAITSAVCVVDNKADPLRPTVRVITNADEILDVAISKYCPVAVNTVLQDIRDRGGRCAYVGLGCQMQGLQLAMEMNPGIRETVALRIGLFCDRVMTYKAADYLVRCCKADPERVRKFDYRSKTWRGYPGDPEVVTDDGNRLHASRYCRIDSRELFTPIHCRLCDDKLNALADISVGDPHGLKSEIPFPTAVIVRSDRGESFVRQAVESGRLDVQPGDYAMVKKGQKIAGRRVSTREFGRYMLGRHLQIPALLHRKNPQIESVRQTPAGRVLHRWQFFIATEKGSQLVEKTPWRIHLLRAVPRWVKKNTLGRLVRCAKSLGILRRIR